MSVEQVGPGGVSNSYGVRVTNVKQEYDNEKAYKEVFIPEGTVPLTATVSSSGGVVFDQPTTDAISVIASAVAAPGGGGGGPTTWGVPIAPNGTTVFGTDVKAYSGAVLLTAPEVGYRIPAGQTGNTSFFTLRLPINDPDFDRFNGKRIRVTYYAEVTNYVTRPYTTGVNLGGSATATNHGITATYDGFRKMLKTVCEITASWTPGDLTAKVEPYLMNGTASALPAEMTLKIIGGFWEPTDATYATSDNKSFAEPFNGLAVRKQIELERIKRQYKPGLGYKVITANADPSATADFVGRNAIQDAIMEATKYATSDNQYEIRCTGTFAATEAAHFAVLSPIPAFISPKNYVHVVGEGNACIIGKLPNGSPAMDALRFDATARIENFTVYATNLNYTCHLEGAGQTPNYERTFINMHFKFDGPTGKQAMGYGASSGERLYIENSTIETTGASAFYVHNNVDFKQPCRWYIRGSKILGGDVAGENFIIDIHSLGSNQKEQLRLENTIVDAGAVRFQDSGWKSSNFAKSDPDHGDIELIAPDLPPKAVRQYFNNTCLKFMSKSTGLASSVSFDPASTAFDAIIGKSSETVDFENEWWRTRQYGYERKVGGVGMRGFAVSGLDISDYSFGGTNPYQRTLGKRLGNCSSVNKTLSVIVDGTTYNVVFNKNYNDTADTAAPSFTTAQVISEITAVIGSVCDVEFYSYAKDHYPVFAGNRSVRNSDSTAILSGMGVIITGQNKARVATNADGRIDGIALDDIAPGKKGRIITCGEIYASNMNMRFSTREVDTVKRVAGVELGISATAPGVFDPAASPKLLRATRENVLEII